MEGVLGIVLVALDSPANMQNHRPVPLDQRDKGRLLPPPEKALQERLIARGLVQSLVNHLPDLSQDGSECCVRHGFSPTNSPLI